MSTAVQTTNPTETFRSIAADRLRSVADMSLHNLVDEFVRLTSAIEAGELPKADGEYGAPKYSDAAKVAIEERKLVNGATRARFGFGFDLYDADF
ncbi:hypothetical protein [Devosia sp. SL43]|uniref:hypothetical protein n=1 Tax=Devosia sp. SL43 TaxID=2806348 RepID=UPI001F1E464E|nr:hypothetical protein [Devosia sp. SL43]UJW87925.1 hypothetical protein IM737_20805 [Devosia sp. SL43]